jgi:hypothetical protein
VKLAKKKYAPRPTPPTRPTTTPTGTGTSPSAPVTPPTTPAAPPTTPVTPPAGPVVPPGPTLADLQPLYPGAQNLTILDLGTPQQGSGTTTQVGGNGQPTNVWIYPVHVSYDTTSQMICTVSYEYGACGVVDPSSPTFTYFTETTHWRSKDNILRDPSGTFTKRDVAASATCDPDPGACTYLGYGGGA